MAEKILSVKNLNVSFPIYSGEVKAIRDVSFDLHKGETLAIVGESGSGKSVTVRRIMRLLANNAHYNQGEILYHEDALLKKNDRQMQAQAIRGNDIAMIFQDPMTSLNPVMRIGDQIAEPIRLHQKATKKEARERALKLLEAVGMPNRKQRMNDYLHQFSGGQRQRIGIARALAVDPKMVIADESISVLDVSI